MASGFTSSVSSPARELNRLFWHLWWIKAPGSTLFIWLFFEGYFFMLRYPHSQVITMPLTWLDTAIPMQWWAWIPYLSLWLYTCLPPALMPDFRRLVFYGVSVGLACGVGLLCFYLWPTAVPPFAKPPGTSLAFLEGIDAAGNACPSLHVGIAVFSALWLHRQLREVRAGRRWLLLNWFWCLAIIYSTMATKQHVALDVLGGTLLGAVTGGLSLRVYARWFARPGASIATAAAA